MCHADFGLSYRVIRAADKHGPRGILPKEINGRATEYYAWWLLG